jgi:hypothetical protein
MEQMMNSPIQVLPQDDLPPTALSLAKIVRPMADDPELRSADPKLILDTLRETFAEMVAAGDFPDDAARDLAWCNANEDQALKIIAGAMGLT